MCLSAQRPLRLAHSQVPIMPWQPRCRSPCLLLVLPWSLAFVFMFLFTLSSIAMPRIDKLSYSTPSPFSKYSSRLIYHCCSTHSEISVVIHSICLLHAHTHIQALSCMHACARPRPHRHMLIPVHSCTYARMHRCCLTCSCPTLRYIYVCMYTYTCVCVYIYIYITMCVYIYIYIYICTHITK